MKPLPEPCTHALVEGLQGSEWRRLSTQYDPEHAKFSETHMRAYAAAERAADLKAMRGALEALQGWCDQPDTSGAYDASMDRALAAITALTERLKD